MRGKVADELMARLRRDAARLAAHFELPLRSLDPERANVKSRYGICYSDGSIRIRLFHATTGRPLKYSSLVNTLCHELAHLKHFNHGKRFRAFYARILEHARAEGMYRPRTMDAPTSANPALGSRPAPPEPQAAAAKPRPAQLELFGETPARRAPGPR